MPCLYRYFAVYFLLAYLNVHNLIFLSMVHEYAYKTYEYISKLANCVSIFSGLLSNHYNGNRKSSSLTVKLLEHP